MERYSTRAALRRLGVVAGVGAGIVASGEARAGYFDLWDMDGAYQLQATYSLGMRLHDKDRRIVDTPGGPEIPVPEYLKVPESANYDDGDRNFKKGALINNRLTLLGEISLTNDQYGLVLRGDAFYDDVYFHTNDNDSPDTINKYDPPHNEFTDDARKYDGGFGRLLDAYVDGTWYVGEEGALTVRVGRHIAAWGESLFFSGVALAQSPADATKATVPGIDVKSILLPVNQISLQYSINDKLTLLGQYKLEYQPTQLNPVGEFFSVSDVVGPGAEFIYGLKNPFYLQNLSDVNLASDDVLETVDLVFELLGVETELTESGIGQVINALDDILPDLNVPTGQIENQPLTPKYINVQRLPDIRPGPFGQYGIGLKYRVTDTLNVGLYHLRYHSTTPAPVQTYGYAPLIEGPNGEPIVTTEVLGIQVPVTYRVRYFDGIHMTAASFSTTMFGVNVAGEASLRDGAEVLVDVDAGINGPVPSPTRAKVWQGLTSAIYSFGPRWFWDSLSVVAEAGYIHVQDVEEVCSPYSCTNSVDGLTYTQNSAGYSLLAIIGNNNVIRGWDLSIPLVHQGMIHGQSSLLSGFGALMGEQDKRVSAGVTMTYLQRLTLGLMYSGYFGRPDHTSNPYGDRDNIGFTVKYTF